jgi:hypothetical protein
MIINSAPKMPPIAQIKTVNNVIAILSPNKNFAAIRTTSPNTAFIASCVPFLRITYKTIAIIIARTSVETSIIANAIMS